VNHRTPIAVALLIGFSLSGAHGQLTIEACHEKARANYPLARQYALIGETRSLDLAMAKRGYLPRLSLSGKASYQSDVTSLSSVASALPPSFASALSGAAVGNDQYLALAEVSQTLWDGGAIRAQIKSVESLSQIDLRKLDVDMYSLYDRVDQLFFGLLAVKEQLKQNDVLKDELEANYRRVEAGIDNGVANQSDLDAVRIEQLDMQQRSIELGSNMKSYGEMLSAMIGEPIAEGTDFAMPDLSEPAASEAKNSRPELELFDAQKKLCDSQMEAVKAANSPKVSAFVQAAYGEPGLNMFKSGFSPYWIGGLRLSWSLNVLLDQKDQFERIDATRASIEAQKDAFALSNEVQVVGIRNDIDRLRKLLSSDDEIIGLREGMRKSVEGKLDNGTATTDDLLKAIDAESLARKAKSLREVQLAKAIYALKNALNE
jgi:outer membrane protein TolC